MTTYRVADLIDETLDAAVCLAEGWTYYENKHGGISVTRADGSSYTHGNFRPKFDADTGRRNPHPTVVEALTIYGDVGFSTDWSLGGPIIARERIDVTVAGDFWDGKIVGWRGTEEDGVAFDTLASGPTPLIAAMRAYVASKFGETVELP